MNASLTLITTKLSNPISATPTLARVSLTQKLGENLTKRLNLLCAGAGYGKTELVTLVLEQWPHPAVWYTIDQYDADETIFARYLIAGLQQAYPSLDWDFLSEASPFSRQQVVSQLINQIQAISQPVVIVLDNFQHIADESSTMALVDLLLSYAPPHLHLIINSRKMPRLGQLSRLRSRGECAVLTATDLAFTTSEIQELSTLLSGSSLPLTIAEQIEDYTQGWPVSVDLTLQMFGVKQPETLKAGQATQQLLEYIKYEVLTQHPQQVQDFLRDTALFEKFTLTLAGPEVLGYEDAPALVAYLQRHNLFLFSDCPQNEVYTYSRQIRQLLQQDLLIEDRNRYLALHQRAAYYFEQNGQLSEALSHYQWAENQEAAMQLLENLAEQMLNNQHLEQLRGWLQCVAPKSQLAHPKILLYRAQLQARIGQPSEALALLSEARRVLSQNYQPHYEMLMLAQMGLIYVQQGDYATASRLMQQALHGATSEVLPPADLNLLISALMAVSENIPTAMDIAQKALYQYELQGDLYGQAQTIIHLAGLALDQGQMTQVNTLLAQSTQIIEQLGFPVYLQVLQATTAARRFRLVGDLSQAEQILADNAILIQDQSISPLFAIKFLQTQSNVYADQGIWAKSEAAAQTALNIATERQVWALKPELIKSLAWLYLRQGDLKAAQKLTLQAQTLTVAENHRQGARVHTLLGIIARRQGFYQEALLHLESAQNTFETQEAAMELWDVRLHLAQTYLELGYEAQAAVCLNQAFAFTRENDVVGGYFWDPGMVASLCVAAIARNIEIRYATCLGAKLVEYLELDDLLVLVESGDTQHSLPCIHLLKAMGTAEAQRQLQKVASSDSICSQVKEQAELAATQLGGQPVESVLPEIRIYCLGNLRVECNGLAIEGSGWAGKSKAGRQKVKTLLAYLVERGVQGATKDELIEALWGSKAWGRDEARLESSLARTLSALRQVLEPNLLPPATSSFILNDEGRYYLNTSLCWIDAKQFETLIKNARAAKSRNDHAGAEVAYQEAKALYRGEYFRDIVGAEEWAGLQRYALSQQLGIALMSLGGYYLEAQAINEALVCYQAAIEQEPTNHTAHYMLIDALRQEGRLEDAILAYQHCRKIFDQEVDEAPPESIVELYEDIQKEIVLSHNKAKMALSSKTVMALAS